MYIYTYIYTYTLYTYTYTCIPHMLQSHTSSQTIENPPTLRNPLPNYYLLCFQARRLREETEHY